MKRWKFWILVILPTFVMFSIGCVFSMDYVFSMPSEDADVVGQYDEDVAIFKLARESLEYAWNIFAFIIILIMTLLGIFVSVYIHRHKSEWCDS